MVRIERKDDGANVSMCGTAEDIMYELGAGTDTLIMTAYERAGKDAAVEMFWDFLLNLALNLLEKGIDVLNEDGEVEEDTVGQKILDALRDMKAADDDDGTEDDLPLF
jgi:predicted RNA methylase